MASTQSPHLSNIPQAVRIAASTDSSIDPNLKQQAIDYLNKVKELCEETWQDCLQLYIQGAGAAGPSSIGKDGREKLETDLRVYCQQVVDTVLLNKPQAVSVEAQQAMSKALVDFVRTEWIEGPGEGGQAFFRNKLSSTLAYLFIVVYPGTIPSFLHPFLALLTPETTPTQASDFHPPLLALHLLTDIALEIHDSTMRSARAWSKDRVVRDGLIRDAIRTTGDENIAVQGLLSLAEKGLEAIQRGDSQSKKWLEVTDLAIKTFSMWTHLNSALTPSTLSFLHRLLQCSVPSLRIAAANVYKTFVGKGIQDPEQRLRVVRGLEVLTLVDPLEVQTREGQDDEDVLALRGAVAGILTEYGTELIAFHENPDHPETLRNEAKKMMDDSLPLLLRFISDPNPDIIAAISPFVADLLRMYKKYHAPKVPALGAKAGRMPPPAVPITPVSTETRDFLAQLQDVLVRQLAWPTDSEWEAPTGDDPDPEDDRAALQAKRVTCRSFIESIAQLDKTLHTEVISRIVAATLETLQSGGPSAVPWQQAELALHLVYTFGEMNKSSTRAAFFELPVELATKTGRDRQHRINTNKAHIDAEMSSGRTTPENGMSEEMLATELPGVDYNSNREKIDYEQYPLTRLGQLLNLCMTSGVIAYPHASVTLQLFEIAVRYSEFWRAKPNSIKPMFQAMLDNRGIHHPDEHVRRRCFYLFSKFIKDCRADLDMEMVSALLDSMKDVMVIQAKLPEPDTPDEDVLIKATTGKNYFLDQLHLFEAAGILVYLTKSDGTRQIPLLEAIAGPPITAVGAGLSAYQRNSQDLQSVLTVHHNLLALGNFAKGFPQVSDAQLETLPYQAPFKQMTEALLQALDGMKTQRIVRDSARFAFSQFVNAIGTSVAELVPQFVSHVVTEFEPTELVDFMMFLGLLIHRLKKNTFETIDMLLLPLLSRIFAILQAPITGTDEAQIHRRLKDAYLTFFIGLMNANLDGVFITQRNQPEFENLLTALLSQAEDSSDSAAQRNAWSFFARSVIAWGTSPAAAAAPSVFADSALSGLSKAVANGAAVATNQHAVSKEERAKQALPGYENFVYQRLIPACFNIPMAKTFNMRTDQLVLWEMSVFIRSTVQARGQEAIDFLLNDILPKINCPVTDAQQLVQQLRTQQQRDFRKTFVDFIRALRS